MTAAIPGIVFGLIMLVSTGALVIALYQGKQRQAAIARRMLSENPNPFDGTACRHE